MQDIEKICNVIDFKFGGEVPYRYVDLLVELFDGALLNHNGCLFSKEVEIKFRHLERVYIDSMYPELMFPESIKIPKRYWIRLCEMVPK